MSICTNVLKSKSWVVDSNSNSAGHSTPRSIVTDKFHDAKSFAHLTSKLLVTEVRRRASNQSTQEAAEAIASYMEIDSGGGGKDDTNNSGWLLLSVLNTLLEEGEAMAQVLSYFIYYIFGFYYVLL